MSEIFTLPEWIFLNLVFGVVIAGLLMKGIK